MKLRRDEDGKVHIIFEGKALKDRRMKIRAGIPIVIRSIEQDVLERQIKLKVTDEIYEDFDCMCREHCKTHDDYIRELRLFARKIGIKHWRLGPEEPPPWRDSSDDGRDPPDPAAWWKL